MLFYLNLFLFMTIINSMKYILAAYHNRNSKKHIFNNLQLNKTNENLKKRIVFRVSFV